jgi:glycosyltransferase involved in cell wall biosynthesis
MSKDILLIVPQLASKGGVSAFWNALLLSFKNFNDIHFKIVEIGGHGKNIFGAVQDQWRVHKLSKLNTSLAILNPSLLNKSFFRDGLFSKQLHRKSIPFIVFFHGWDMDFEKKIDKSYINFFLHSFAHAQTIFVLSPEFKDKLIEWGYRGKVVVETTFIDSRLIENFSLKNKLEKREKPQTIKILFLARLEREKGIFELTEAFKELSKERLKPSLPSFSKDIELIVAGEGKDFKELKEFLKDEINIHVVGEVEGEEKVKLFSQSDIYCLPSYSEGLPISVLEAISFGLPVITTEVGGLKYFFQNEKMGKMITPKDANQIKNALEELLSDRNSMDTIAKFNFDYGQKYLTNTVMAERIYPYLKENKQ